MVFLNDDSLPCPRCTHPYLHQIETQIFHTGDEWSGPGHHVTASHEGVFIDREFKGNPSRDRHGLTIKFACELCSNLDDETDRIFPKLLIYQHKGFTIFDWSDTRSIKDVRDEKAHLEYFKARFAGAKK